MDDAGQRGRVFVGLLHANLSLAALASGQQQTKAERKRQPAAVLASARCSTPQDTTAGTQPNA